ncbi:MAG: PIN domain-containing protein [Nanoarchaeota archaeon]|nr:PIN domain-containing protein [Nanoarchaeota archaeon]
MKEYFFDTYAIIELIKGNPKYEFVKDFTIITGVMNLAEVYYALLLENKKEKVDSFITNLNLQLLNILSDTAIKGALFRYQHKKANFSYIDSVGYILALDNNFIFLTGDKEFEDLENVEFVKK